MPRTTLASRRSARSSRWKWRPISAVISKPLYNDSNLRLTAYVPSSDREQAMRSLAIWVGWEMDMSDTPELTAKERWKRIGIFFKYVFAAIGVATALFLAVFWFIELLPG